MNWEGGKNGDQGKSGRARLAGSGIEFTSM
jgi:hypothetical protein